MFTTKVVVMTEQGSQVSSRSLIADSSELAQRKDSQQLVQEATSFYSSSNLLLLIMKREKRFRITLGVTSRYEDRFKYFVIHDNVVHTGRLNVCPRHARTSP